MKPSGLVAGKVAQVVQVRNGQGGEPLVAGIAKQAIGALQEHFGGWPGECAMQRIGLSKQGHVSAGEPAGKTLRWGAIALDQTRAVEKSAHQPGELLSRVARGPFDIAQHRAFVVPAKPSIGKAIEHRGDETVALGIAADALKFDFECAIEKGAQLRHRFEPRFVHVDHHRRDDRSKSHASDSYPVGNTAPRSDSYHIGIDSRWTI